VVRVVQKFQGTGEYTRRSQPFVDQSSSSFWDVWNQS